MGVDRTVYLMIAVDLNKFPDFEFSFDDLEEEIGGTPTSRFDVVYDGMSGEYTMAGKILAKADEYDVLPHQILWKDIEELAHEYSARVSAKIGLTLGPENFSLVMFTHFS
jgi:hypothetical protein